MRAHVALLGASVGAWWELGVPGWAAVAAALLALAWRRHRWLGTAALALMVVLVASASASHARASLDPPEAGPFDEWVTLVDDPRAAGPVGIRATVRAGDRRMTATAHGPVSGRFDDVLAGQRVRLVGSVRPVDPDDEWALARHVVGRVTVAEVAGVSAAAPLGRFANTIRGSLERGAATLDDTERPLFLGMVIGDDRGQSPVTADDFRAAGLGHLLVVSGQNVAFVLAVVMPLAGRFRPAGRALCLFIVLGLFAVVTRFEPSVLRATAMAGVGIGSAALGRPVDGRRGLSLACTGLLLFDPFLIRLVAFQLSAAATAGIVWFGAPLAERLPGPAWLRVATSTTASAQLAVSPILITIFGPLPVASLPANLLAGPASGFVMMWGCTAGLLAGICGGKVAAVLHLPTRLLLWWVDVVAGASATGPPAMLGPGSLVALAVIAGVAVVSRARSLSGVLCGAGAIAVLAAAVAGAPAPADGTHTLGEGATLVVDGASTVVILDDPGAPQAVLERIRRSGADPPVLIVALDGDRADADASIALRRRYGPVAIAAPPMHAVPEARTVRPGQVLVAAGQRLRVDAVTPRLAISILASDPGR